MNHKLAKQIKECFPKHIAYGITKNTNEKYWNLGYRTLIVAVFPYYYQKNTKIFSKYASVYDYHIVVKEEVEKIFKPLGVEYLCFTDVSPFAEKELSEELGLGEIGRHNLLLTPQYSSFVFIGEILLKDELPEHKIVSPKLCTGCNCCVKACPTGALTGGFQREKCLSYLTQKKNLTEEEEKLLRQSDTVWGCDLCQLACPLTKTAACTPISKFQEPVLKLDKETILKLEDDVFRETYREFAFAYKGVEILKRNVRLTDEKQI